MREFNLLPKKIKESHNIFDLKWYGIILVICIIMATIYGNNVNIRLKSRLAELKARYSVVDAELKEKEAFFKQYSSYEARIDEIRQANTNSVSIASKNIWNHVISRLADFANRNPMLWIEHVNNNNAENRLVFRGKSYNRERITNLATLFDNGHIMRITESNIAGHHVWDFEITFPRPTIEGATHIPMPRYLQTYENYLEYLMELRNQRVSQRTTPTEQTATPTPTPVAARPATPATPAVAARPATPATPATPAVAARPATPATPATPAQVAGHSDPKALYGLARDSYLSNDFPEAIKLLDIYVANFPNGEEIALVYYLLGEINFILNNFESAVTYFMEVHKLRRDKVAESLFFTSKSFEGLSDFDNAIKYYGILVAEFPSNPLARTADEQLRLLKGEYQ